MNFHDFSICGRPARASTTSPASLSRNTRLIRAGLGERALDAADRRKAAEALLILVEGALI